MALREKYARDCTRLEALHLWNYAPKCRNLRELERLKKLTELELIQTRIDTREGIAQLSALENCVGLENVVLEHVPKIKPPSKNDIVW